MIDRLAIKNINKLIYLIIFFDRISRYMNIWNPQKLSPDQMSMNKKPVKNKINHLQSSWNKNAIRRYNATLH